MSYRIDLKNDWLFKHIFGEKIVDENNPDNDNPYTLEMLNTLLELHGDDKLESVSFDNPQLNVVRPDGKLCITVVYCRTKNRGNFIVEMQVLDHAGWAQRVQTYAAKAYSSQLRSRGNYITVEPVHLLAIMNFVMFPDIDNGLTHHSIIEHSSNNCYLQGMKWTLLELPKFTKREASNDPVSRWANMFIDASRTLPSTSGICPVGGNDVVEKIKNIAFEATCTSVGRFEYDKSSESMKISIATVDAALEAGMQAGMQTGIQTGMQTKALDIAKKLKMEGNNKDYVISITGIGENEYDLL
eukprot:Pgem_evm1s145